MVQENFDEEFDQLHQPVKALEKRVQELEQPQTVVLVREDGGFKVELSVKGLDLTATPLLLNKLTGKWERAGDSGNIAGWSVAPGGSLIRMR